MNQFTGTKAVCIEQRYYENIFAPHKSQIHN